MALKTRAMTKALATRSACAFVVASAAGLFQSIPAWAGSASHEVVVAAQAQVVERKKFMFATNALINIGRIAEQAINQAGEQWTRQVALAEHWEPLVFTVSADKRSEQSVNVSLEAEVDVLYQQVVQRPPHLPMIHKFERTFAPDEEHREHFATRCARAQLDQAVPKGHERSGQLLGEPELVWQNHWIFSPFRYRHYKQDCLVTTQTRQICLLMEWHPEACEYERRHETIWLRHEVNCAREQGGWHCTTERQAPYVPNFGQRLAELLDG